MSAKHEGIPIRAKGRPEREYRSAKHEGVSIRANAGMCGTKVLQ